MRARTITPDDALLEYLADHGMRRISKRLLSSGIIDIVAGAIPGIRDILVLGKVKQIERSGIADLVLVDAPATGHTMTFLSSAGGLLDAARGGPDPGPGRRRGRPALRPGPVPGGPGHPARGDAGQRGHRGRLPARGQGGHRPRPGHRERLLPALRRAGHPGRPGGRGAPGWRLDPAWSAALERPAGSGCTRQELQEDQLERLAHELPLPQLRVPYLFTASIGPAELDTLSAALAAGVEALHDPARAAS